MSTVQTRTRIPSALRASIEALDAVIHVTEYRNASFWIQESDRSDGVFLLCMTDYVPDTDVPDGDLIALTIRTEVEPDAPAADQIRDLIVAFVTHEADERIVIGGEQPFYPDLQHQNTLTHGV